MACVVIEHLSKFFTGPRGEKVRAIEDMSLTVQEGELLTLVGPSGCGKTTTLRLLSGLEEPSSGSIIMDGQPVNDVAPKDRDIAMVFQNSALYPHLTARENISFGLRLRKCPRAELEHRLQEAAELLNLTDCLDRRPAELSGGQCQRVALGRAIVRRPRLFLFDEPLSNLDTQMRTQLRTEISRLHKKLAATVIYVTHDQGEAAMLGHRVAVMNEGTIQQVAAPGELDRYPRNVFVAGFIGSPGMNFFEGSLTQDGDGLRFDELNKKGDGASDSLKARCPDYCARALQGYIGKKVLLGIRPEAIRNETSLLAGSCSDGSIVAVVEFLERSAAAVYLHLRRGEAALVAQATSADRVSVGQRISLALDLPQARFFDATTREAIPCEF